MGSVTSPGPAHDELVEDRLAGRRHPVPEPGSFQHDKASAGHQPLDGGAEPDMLAFPVGKDAPEGP